MHINIGNVEKWVYQRRESFIGLVFYSLAALFLFKNHMILAYLLIYVVSLWKINDIKDVVLRFGKSTIAIKFYNIAVWYVSYLLSTKLLSYFFSINESELKFSPGILAVPVSIILIYLLVLVCALFPMVIMQVIPFLSIFISRSIKNRVSESTFYKVCKNYYHLIIVLSPLYILVAFAIPYVVKVSLLADAQFVSDCGPKQHDKMYLTVNEKECYELTLDRNYLFSNPQLIPKPAKKGM